MAKTSPVEFARQVKAEVKKVTWPSRQETLVSLVAVFAIGGALTMVGRVIHSRVTPVAEFGESMMWTSIGGWAIQIYVAIAGVSLILAIRERLPSESTVS